MMTIIWNLLLLLFFLKLFWNIFTPCAAALAYRAWKKNGGKKPGGISMAVLIELGLWLIIEGLSFVTHDGFFNYGPLQTFFLGLSGILLSYGLVVIVGIAVRKISPV